MTKTAKIGWLYAISAVFIAVCMYFMVNKDNYYAFAIPVVLGVMLLYVFSMEKVLLFISFLTPLSINIENIGGFAISLPVEPMLFGVLALFFAKLIYEGHFDIKIASHPLSWVIYVMFLWMVVTTITSEMPFVSLKHTLSRLWFVVPAYFMCALLFKRKALIDKFIWLYIAGLIIVVFYTIVNHMGYGFDGKSAHWVMTPFYNDHTAYGAALAMYFVLAVAYAFMPGLSKLKRLLIYAVIAILAVALALSYCRAAWVSLVGAAAVLICVLLKIKFRWILTTFVTLVALFFTFQHQIIDVLERNEQDASSDIVENIKSITNISTDASNLERINRWQSALRLFNERPFFGWGPGTYQFVYAPYQMSKEKTIISTNAGDGGNAHSEYIGALAEMGVFGTLIVIILVATAITRALKAYARAKNKETKILLLGAMLAIISYFIHGILNNFLDTDKLSIPVWSCLAIIAILDSYYADKESFIGPDDNDKSSDHTSK